MGRIPGVSLIKSINLSSVANYAPGAHNLNDLTTVNFVYGHNGSGKTTLSRLLRSPSAPDMMGCSVTWSKGINRDVLVYNSDFAADTIRQPNGLRGVFTIGEKDAKLIDEIAAKRASIVDLEKKIGTTLPLIDPTAGPAPLANRPGQLLGDFEDECWTLFKRYDPDFQDAFKGLRNNRKKFCERVLKESDTHHSNVRPVEELREEGARVFDDSVGAVPVPPTPDVESIAKIGEAAVLREAIAGAKNVDMAALIDRLRTADWVRDGLRFLIHSEPNCPFCQQPVSGDLRNKLEQYFDDAYARKIQILKDLVDDHHATSDRVLGALDAWLMIPSVVADTSRLRELTGKVQQVLTESWSRLDAKVKEPSRIVDLPDLRLIAADVASEVEALGKQLARHNSMVANRASARDQLNRDVWAHIVKIDLQKRIERYKKDQAGATKALADKKEEVSKARQAKLTTEAELATLERKTTSVRPTVDSINKTLETFGFRTFKVTLASDERTYRLVRPDGKPAADTLSEGERTFISFLYFYHLIDGSTSGDAGSQCRVVVIDDPISSLDSEVLFIVSSLTRRLLDRVWKGTDRVSQVLLLTHNIHFFKEVTFESTEMRRKGGGSQPRRFWVLRKTDRGTTVEAHKNNPIKTTYELLWREVQKSSDDGVSVQNAMRRILENYFKVLGGIDTIGIIDKFDGADQVIVQALFSWVNDGSHSAWDDHFLVPDERARSRYRDVFKLIFEKTGQMGHYEMMMSGLRDQ
jgi:wobble nucleotide-excising tRNase